MPESRTALLGGLVAALLLLGCADTSGGAASDDAATGTTAESTEPASQPRPHTGDGGQGGGRNHHNRGKQGDRGDVDVPEALDFSATQVSGEGFDARRLAGTDTVFWFWAPWCVECAAAAGDIQATASTTPGVTFVGVAGLSSDVDSMQTFVEDHELTFTQLSDGDGSLFTRFGVAQQDTFVLVSADGEVETVPSYGDSVDLDALVADAFA